VVYALLVDRVESRGLAQFQASAALIAAGSKTELVDPDRQRVLFDAWLDEPLKPLNPEDVERLELLQALGLR
jgi:hypothetical protein